MKFSLSPSRAIPFIFQYTHGFNDELSNMNFHSSKLIWLQLLPSAQSFCLCMLSTFSITVLNICIVIISISLSVNVIICVIPQLVLILVLPFRFCFILELVCFVILLLLFLKTRHVVSSNRTFYLGQYFDFVLYLFQLQLSEHTKSSSVLVFVSSLDMSFLSTPQRESVSLL